MFFFFYRIWASISFSYVALKLLAMEDIYRALPIEMWNFLNYMACYFAIHGIYYNDKCNKDHFYQKCSCISDFYKIFVVGSFILEELKWIYGE